MTPVYILSAVRTAIGSFGGSLKECAPIDLGIINLPAGTYQLDRSLSLTVDGVTLRGEGMDKTILNFKGSALYPPAGHGRSRQARFSPFVPNDESREDQRHC